MPGWLRVAYPALFGHPRLPERLRLYDMVVELAIAAHHPVADDRGTARARIGRLLAGRDDLDRRRLGGGGP